MTQCVNYPSISVIVPSFNQGQYIEETILSIVGQEYPNLEILVIDGGSTDNTVEILEKYSDKLFYWHSKKDKGQADAINQGIKLSSGEIICWINSDDMLLPGTLLDVGKRLCKHTDEAYLIYGAAVTIKQNNGTVISKTQSSIPFNAFQLTYHDFLVQPSTFWTRKLFQCVGELNIRYSYVLDWEWFIRASKVAKFEYVPRFYSLYRHHFSHKTSNGGVERRKEIIEVIEIYSSNYWKKLYCQTDKSHTKIKEILTLFRKLKVRGHIWLMLVFLPEFWTIIKDPRDFRIVLGMLGVFQEIAIENAKYKDNKARLKYIKKLVSS